MSIYIPSDEHKNKKTVPYNIDVERAVLAILMLDPESSNIVFERIQYDHFYLESHKIIAQAIFSMSANAIAVDMLTLINYLEDKSLIERAGGHAYISSLVDSLPSTANLDYYLKIILDKFEIRKLINVCNGIISDAYDGSTDATSLVDQAEQRIFDIAQNRLSVDTMEVVRPILNRTVDVLENFYSRSDRYIGIQSGFYDLDDITGGFQNQELIILAARPGVGKTAFALNIIDYAAVNLNQKVAIFSLEMSKMSLVLRMICARAKINSHKLRQGKFPSTGWQQLTDAVSKLTDTNIYIDDATDLTPLKIRQKCRRLKSDREHGGLDLVVIDYLQLLSPSDPNKRYDSKANEVASISKELKALARELDVPVIALSQLNRKPADRHSKKPMLSDLRDSGAIEQDADVVMFIHRDDYYDEGEGSENKDNPEGKSEYDEIKKDTTMAEIIVAKQRNGPTDTIKLTLQKSYLKFENYTQSIE